MEARPARTPRGPQVEGLRCTAGGRPVRRAGPGGRAAGQGRRGQGRR